MLTRERLHNTNCLHYTGMANRKGQPIVEPIQQQFDLFSLSSNLLYKWMQQTSQELNRKSAKNSGIRKYQGNDHMTKCTYMITLHKVLYLQIHVFNFFLQFIQFHPLVVFKRNHKQHLCVFLARKTILTKRQIIILWKQYVQCLSSQHKEVEHQKRQHHSTPNLSTCVR